MRALVIGAETAGLAGVNNDARDVAAWLGGCGFAVDLRIDAAATRDAMLDGLRALVADLRGDDPAVIYYAGHGGMLELVDRPPARLGYLVPFDHDAGGPFRGITELEWSALIGSLTERTRNATVIHDCCHAARTVRGAQLPRGRARALAAVRLRASDVAPIEAAGSARVYPLGNPHAVRLGAASGYGLAWERASTSGRTQGVLTSALLAEADALRERAISWAELGRRVRDAVVRATGGRQRPEIEGPTRRRIFGLDAATAPPTIRVRPEGRRFVLGAGRAHGIECADVFRSADHGPSFAVVTQVGLFESIVRVGPPGATRAFDAVPATRRASADVLRRTADELDDPEHLAMTVDRIAAAPGELVDDSEIGPGDRLCVHLTNRTQRTLWLHVFAVGPDCAAEALGPVSSGIPIESRATETLGAVPALGAIGFTLACSSPGAIELIAIATTMPVDLSGLIAPDPGARIAQALDAIDTSSMTEASRDVRPAPDENRVFAARRRLQHR